LFYNAFFREWLTSFSKRKKERQDKAKEDLATLLKEENFEGGESTAT